MKFLITFLLCWLCLNTNAQKPWDIAGYLVNNDPYEKCFSDISRFLQLDDYKKAYDKAWQPYYILDRCESKPVNLVAIESPKFDSLKNFFERNNINEMVYRQSSYSPLKKYTFQPHLHAFVADYFKVYDEFIPYNSDRYSRGFYVYDTVEYKDEYTPSSEADETIYIDDFAYHPFRELSELEKDRLKKEFDTVIFQDDGKLKFLCKIHCTTRFKSWDEYENYMKNFNDSIQKLVDNKIYFREFFLKKQHFSEDELKEIYKHLKNKKSSHYSFSKPGFLVDLLRVSTVKNYTRVAVKRYSIENSIKELVYVHQFYFDEQQNLCSYTKQDYYSGNKYSDSIAFFRNENQKISRIEHYYPRTYYEPDYLSITHFDYDDNLNLKKVAVCGMKTDGNKNNPYTCASDTKCEPLWEYSYDEKGNLTGIKNLQSIRKISYTEFNRPEKIEVFSITRDTTEFSVGYQFIYTDTLLQKVRLIYGENSFKGCQPEIADACYFQQDEKGKIISSDLFTLFYNENKKPERLLKTSIYVHSTYERNILSMEKNATAFSYDERGWPENSRSYFYDVLYFTYKK